MSNVTVSLAIACALFVLAPSDVAYAKVDTDGDGLTDEREQFMGTDPHTADTDGDGYEDRLEITNGYDPLNPAPVKAKKSIRVRLKPQKLAYSLGKTRIGEMRISSGKWNLPTPKGTFSIINKVPRAWSKAYSLWMPYWMGFKGGKFGIHELPEWPNGTKEGANHIGKPVSHGCIRLGVGDAKKLFDWTPTGTTLTITD